MDGSTKGNASMVTPKSDMNPFPDASMSDMIHLDNPAQTHFSQTTKAQNLRYIQPDANDPMTVAKNNNAQLEQPMHISITEEEGQVLICNDSPRQTRLMNSQKNKPVRAFKMNFHERER